ncbi:site-specific integrase [Mycetocola zhujimingii]|uniref:Tyr recombinase domain-containing protein n=1 Tax=Mycetocola zhujimingii TaxID=2079792 RepID=A0A2U1TCG6_9MICO|nr:site-specific integrase [Mycetocola zhujimingii]PWC06574.1 hypothetical protein DF223_10755 [Mycetocola zhujimingii]
MIDSNDMDWRSDGQFETETESYIDDIVKAAYDAPYPTSELTRTFSGLVRWAIELGLPIDREVVLSESILSAFIASGLPQYTDAGRANARSLLRAMRIALDGTVRPEPLSSSDPSAPYSNLNVRRLRSWADAQSTEEYRRDARSILGLGIGAGLTAGEIADLPGDAVRVGRTGVRVIVASGRLRTVQVRREWEEPLAAQAKVRTAADYFIRPKRTATSRNFLSNLVERSAGPAYRPQSQRMRATWIVQHLGAGTPMNVLMDAAGVQSLEAFMRFMRFVPDVPVVEARRLLRGDW